MTEDMSSLDILGGEHTEELVSFVFSNLPDDIVDEISLERFGPEKGGVAKEFVTIGAALTFSSVLAVQIFGLIQRYMEEKRQEEALKLIYKAAKEDIRVAEILADIEKHHVTQIAKYGPVDLQVPLPKSSG